MTEVNDAEVKTPTHDLLSHLLEGLNHDHIEVGRCVILTEFVERVCDGEAIWDVLAALTTVAARVMAQSPKSEELYQTFGEVLSETLSHEQALTETSYKMATEKATLQ